ncbi:MAG TPA: hypothetical protein VHG28_17685 [Longimicrobiaceae bacterium]|nr:hypothetical protein [Longimicrobiaceae bacterium]
MRRQEREKREKRDETREIRQVAEPPAAYAPGSLEEELREALSLGREGSIRWAKEFLGALRAHRDRFPPGAESLGEILLRRLEQGPPGGRGRGGKK